jgi:hypothetical protein
MPLNCDEILGLAAHFDDSADRAQVRCWCPELVALYRQTAADIRAQLFVLPECVDPGASWI